MEYGIRDAVAFRQSVWKKGTKRLHSWAGLWLPYVEDTLGTTKDVVASCVGGVVAYPSRLLPVLIHNTQLLANNPESAGTWDHPAFFERLRSECLDSLAEPVGPGAGEWVLETSTGTRKNCLLSQTGSVFSETHPVHHAHIFAILNVLGKHEALAAIQAYPSWPLILRAWYRLPLLYRGDCGRLWTPSRKPIS